jgi:hypothetical protein
MKIKPFILLCGCLLFAGYEITNGKSWRSRRFGRKEGVNIRGGCTEPSEANPYFCTHWAGKELVQCSATSDNIHKSEFSWFPYSVSLMASAATESFLFAPILPGQNKTIVGVQYVYKLAILW